MTGEFLTPAEVRQLAGDARTYDAQVSELAAQGVPYRVVRGRILVSRIHAREWLKGVVVAPSRAPALERVK